MLKQSHKGGVVIHDGVPRVFITDDFGNLVAFDAAQFNFHYIGWNQP